MSLQIDSLPDECLLRVFHWLPETDLFGVVSLVCQKWFRLLPVALKSRTRLTVLVGPDPVLQLTDLSKFYVPHSESLNSPNLIEPWKISENTVRGARVERLTERHTQRVIETFPNLTRLTIVLEFVSCEQMKHALTLARYYSANLITLEIYCVFLDESDEPKVQFNVAMKTLFLNLNTLERFPKLQHLTLHIDDCPLLNDHPVLDWFLLKRLKTLHFYCRHCREVHFPLVFAGNADASANDFDFSQLEHVGLWGKMPTEELLEQYMKLPASFACKFTSIFDNYSSFDKSILPDFFTRFCGLIYVSLDIITNWKLPALTRALAPLVRLESVKLIINCPTAGLMPAQTDTNTDNSLVPLQTVKVLKICIELESHHDIDRLHLADMFPNIHYLDVVADRTFTCSECPPSAETESGVEQNACCSELLNSLERLKQTMPLEAITYSTLWAY